MRCRKTKTEFFGVRRETAETVGRAATYSLRLVALAGMTSVVDTHYETRIPHPVHGRQRIEFLLGSSIAAPTWRTSRLLNRSARRCSNESPPSLVGCAPSKL